VEYFRHRALTDSLAVLPDGQRAWHAHASPFGVRLRQSFTKRIPSQAAVARDAPH